MEKKILLNLFFPLLPCLPFTKAACQSMADYSMIANSEKWNVNYKQGTLTLTQPGSNQTFTMNLIKLDSGKIKQKKKDSAEIEFSGSDGFDQSKFMTIKKSRVYKLQPELMKIRLKLCLQLQINQIKKDKLSWAKY